MKYLFLGKEITFENLDKLEQYLENNRRKKTKSTIDFDIETLKYNTQVEKISEVKGVTYSLCLGFWNDENELIKVFLPDWQPFFTMLERLSKKSWGHRNLIIELVAHNAMGFDNHYLRQDLLFYYPYAQVENTLLPQIDKAIKKQELTNNTKPLPDFTSLAINKMKKEKDKIIIGEKRVRSKNKLTLDISFYGIHLTTIDTAMKVAGSLATIGEKMVKAKIIDKTMTKTDGLDYDKYNQVNDMSDYDSRLYAYEVWQHIMENEPEEKLYIENDINVLSYFRKNYSLLFPSFDFDKMTFTVNIKDAYCINELSHFQLLNDYYHKDLKGKIVKDKLEYTSYSFNGENLYSYLKKFYNGGLTIYNFNHIGKIINEPCFSADINSSYPSVIYKGYVPTTIKSYKEFKVRTMFKTKRTDNDFFIFSMTKQDFNDYVIRFFDSEVFKTIIVKYYTKADGGENLFLNSKTLDLIYHVEKIDFREIDLPILSFIDFHTEKFGANSVIDHYYKIKQCGASDYLLDYKDPLNISYVLDENGQKIPNPNKVSNEQKALSKVILNGLYGLPALRPFFDVFVRDINEVYVNIHNGFANSERNIVFSIWVTANSFYNLLYPLGFLTGKEIDENFLYTDTDSLYMKRGKDDCIFNKFPKEILDDNILGHWAIEHSNMSYFYILHNKKYAFMENGKIGFRSGGVRKMAFNTDYENFEDFIKEQFSRGVKKKSTRSVLNKQLVPIIYESIVELQSGERILPTGYNREIIQQIKNRDEYYRHLYQSGFEELDLDGLQENISEPLYLDDIFGSRSVSDLAPVELKKDNYLTIEELILSQKTIMKRIHTNKEQA